jgi:F-type H+-transporting ATPase subunit delta
MDKNVILAKKYGRAIYEIAAEQHSLKETEEGLRLIVDTINENQELADLLNHPLLGKDVKKNTIKEIFAGKVQPIVLQFCYVVIDKGRINVLANMVDIYTALAHEGMGVEEATVTTALPLSDKQVELLKSKLSEVFGKKIIIKQKVDSALIGGFTIQVGDRLIDGSIARQLNTLKAKMMQRG